jgi:hypothetical protein
MVREDLAPVVEARTGGLDIMTREAQLPAQWQCLEGRVHFVQKVTAVEYHASCFACGGSPHPNGEWPDRLVLIADEHPRCFCRKCGLKAFPDQLGDSTYSRPSPEQVETWRREMEEREQDRKQSAERALAHLRDTKLWERYADMCGDREQQHWIARGIPSGFQVLWTLGFDHQRQSLTIPLFDASGNIANIKHRYLDPPPGRGRYFYELPGQPQPMFRCTPEEPLTGNVTVVEGEIKAMVLFVTLDDSNERIVGLPGLNPSAGIVKELEQAEQITLILDPGADKRGPDGQPAPGAKVVMDLGRGRCRVLIPPAKIDDMLLAMAADRWDARRLLKQAKAV